MIFSFQNEDGREEVGKHKRSLRYPHGIKQINSLSSKQEKSHINRNCAEAVDVGRPNNFDMYQSRAPVRLIPSATTKSVKTVNNPSLEKPARASSMVIMFAAINSVNEPIMTYSLTRQRQRQRQRSII